MQLRVHFLEVLLSPDQRVQRGRRLRPKFHLARLDSTRHDSTRSTLSSESSRACSDMADDEQAIVLACTSLVVFYDLAYTNPICFVK